MNEVLHLLPQRESQNQLEDPIPHPGLLIQLTLKEFQSFVQAQERLGFQARLLNFLIYRFQDLDILMDFQELQDQ